MKKVAGIKIISTPKPIYLLTTYGLIGLTCVCLMATIQFHRLGAPFLLKNYIIPILVGTISGLLVGWLQLRIYRLLTQERQAVLSLQEQRQQTLAILESIPDGLLAIDNNGTIQMANEQASKMLAIPQKRILGHQLDAILPITTTDNNQLMVQFDNYCQTTQLKNITSTTSTIKSTNAQDQARIVLLHDNSAAQRIDQIKAEFISNATHNLKTPITAITGYTELLLDQQNFSAEQTAEFLHYINDNAWKLDSLVNNLLDINRAESGRKISLSTQPYTAVKLFSALKKYCRTKNTPDRIFFKPNDTNCALNIDIVKLEIVLENLVSNAIKFSPKNSPITISGKQQGSRYVLSVRDEGIGMTQDQCPQIFNKFYRVDGSDSGKQGFGLGLTLVKNIIESHGGEIWATSMPKQGTTLSFSLPIIDTVGHDN
jgi:signal transduction histidine kinase